MVDMEGLSRDSIRVSQYGDDKEIAENIRYSLSLGFTEFTPSLTVHDGIVCIVGSGPSVKTQISNIRHERELGRPIVAINGAHDLLCDNDITPDLFVTCDPRGMPQNFKRLNDKTIYLVASRIAKSDIDLLKGRQVVIWHSAGRECEDKLLTSKIRVGGGTTSGLRSVTLMYLQGFRTFHLYGFDCCLDENRAKRFNSGPLNPETKTMTIRVGEREFTCNMAMLQQANEFQDYYEFMPDATFVSFGDGVITEIIKERNKKRRERESIYRDGQPSAGSPDGVGTLDKEKGKQAGLNYISTD